MSMDKFLDAVFRRGVFMAKFGDVCFSADTISFENIKKNISVKLKKYEMISGENAIQNLGVTEERLHITGTFYLEYHSKADEKLEKLYEILRNGKSELLTLTSTESATNEGHWLLEKIEETQSIFKSNGEAQKTTFCLDLIKVSS